MGEPHTSSMNASASDRPSWAEPGEQLGDPDKFGIFVESATIAGTNVTLPGPGVTAIVGANNVGKSTLLRNLRAEVLAPGSSAGSAVRLVTETQARTEGTAADFKAWLGRHSVFRPANPSIGEGSSFWRPTFQVPVDGAANLWESIPWNSRNESLTYNPNDAHKRIGGALIYTADVMGRFQEVAGTPQRHDVTEPPSHALHQLQDDATLLKRLNDICQQIFRTPLTLDSVSGYIRLRIGIPDVTAPLMDQSQHAYRASLGRMPTLEAQGDGMRSLLVVCLQNS